MTTRRLFSLITSLLATLASYHFLFSPSLSIERIDIHLKRINEEYRIITDEAEIHKNNPENASHRTIKITQLSDIHWDERNSKIKPEMLTESIKISNDFDPDLVFITGDIVDRSAEPIFSLSPFLKSIKSKRGNFAVLGNHDYLVDNFTFQRNPKEESCESEKRTINALGLSGSEIIRRTLEESGVRVLTNESQHPFKDHLVSVVGIGESKSSEYHPERILKENDTQISPLTLVLSHNPETAHNLSKYSYTIQFSGHTHGGQICIPFTKIPLIKYLRPFVSRLPNFLTKGLPGLLSRNDRVTWKWFQGLHEVKRKGREGSNWLYTSRGLASSLRFFCDPEVTLFQIHLYD
eukprot:TRINITY_DN12934_c0_g1_i1.p1 TRINITY_DN12934_c0_g1~~TRINITY_DN12934_c0_g1_i1.p1  ORF type:complete len:350 (+),score=92.95 TRINITY_DN12934_c0_g1_i1:150-1199(+)